jgi:hypothetical protein
VGAGGVGSRRILAGTVLGMCAKVRLVCACEWVSDATGASCGRSCLWGCHRFWSDKGVVAVRRSWCAGNDGEELGRIMPGYRMFQHQNFALVCFVIIAEVSMTEIGIQSWMSKARPGHQVANAMIVHFRVCLNIFNESRRLGVCLEFKVAGGWDQS